MRCAHGGLSQRSQERGAGCAQQTRGAEQTGQPLGRGLSSARTQRPSQTEPARFYFCFQPLFGIPGQQSATSPPSRITGPLGKEKHLLAGLPCPRSANEQADPHRRGRPDPLAPSPGRAPSAPSPAPRPGGEPHLPRETACRPRTLVSRCKGTCALPALPTRIDLTLPSSHNSPAVNSALGPQFTPQTGLSPSPYMPPQVLNQALMWPHRLSAWPQPEPHKCSPRESPKEAGWGPAAGTSSHSEPLPGSRLPPHPSAPPRPPPRGLVATQLRRPSWQRALEVALPPE